MIEHYESDDDNAISLEKIKNETLGLVEKDDSRPVSRATEHVTTSEPIQAPFQPSSTPIHLEHRLVITYNFFSFCKVDFFFFYDHYNYFFS